MRRRSICFSLVVAGALLASFAPTAVAADNFTCRASALRITSPLLNSEPVVANRNNNPCENESAQALNGGISGLATANALNAQTDNGTNGATSRASVANANVTLAEQAVAATVLESNAAVTCTGGTPANPHHPELGGGTSGTPTFSGSTTIATLNINGNTVVVTGAPNQTIKIPRNDGRTLTVVINEQIREDDRITVRALRVSSPLLRTDVVVAESIADVSGNPCPVPH